MQPGFSNTAANGPVVLDICRRLDGIPLAIELAAARTQLLSVEQIRGLLEDRLALLSGRGRAAPRHQTLGAALQWSYDLLTGEEQRTLRLLSVFQGGWTLSAATAVCGERVGGVEVLDLLWRLVEKSLVEVVHTAGSEARYRLLEMVRQFAFDRLVAAAEAPDAQVRHAAHFLGEFERAIPDLIGPREVETVARSSGSSIIFSSPSTKARGSTAGPSASCAPLRTDGCCGSGTAASRSEETCWRRHSSAPRGIPAVEPGP